MCLSPFIYQKLFDSGIVPLRLFRDSIPAEEAKETVWKLKAVAAVSIQTGVIITTAVGCNAQSTTEAKRPFYPSLSGHAKSQRTKDKRELQETGPFTR